jgi:hypothetical protein
MARNLGSLTVDLILKMGGFKQGMDEAARATDDANKKLRGLARDGQQLAAALANPFEKLQASVKAYDELLKAGAITQETYTRAVQAAGETFAQSDAATLKHNATLAEGAKLTQSLLTPTEKYEQELKRLDTLLKEGAISQETHNRAVARAQTGLKQASAGVESFGSTILAANRLLLGFGVGFTAVGILSELKRAAAEAIEFGDTIDKLSTKTGIGSETLTELAYAAKQADIPLEALGVSFKKMQVAIAEAGAGGKEQLATFKALGIEFDTIKNLSADDAFELIAEQIHRLGDEAQQNLAATRLFGKSGAELLPLFKDGAAGVRALREEAQKLGLTLSNEQVSGLADLDNAVKRLSASYDALTRQLVGSVAPEIATFFQSITFALAQSKKDSYDARTALEAIFGAVADHGIFTSFADLQAEVEKSGKSVVNLTILKEAFFAAVKKNGLTADFGDVIDEARRLQLEFEHLQKVADASAPLGSNRRTQAVSRAPAPVGFQPEPEKPKTEGLTEAQRELKAAREQVEAFTQSLIEQRETLNLTDAETLKYSITQGDLAKALEKLGPAGEQAREQLLGLADALGKETATKAINDQIAALKEQAATIGLTEDQAFEYSLTQGDLAKQIAATGGDIQAQTQALREQHDQLVANQKAAAAREEAKQIFDETRTSAEKYAAELDHLHEIATQTGLDQETVGRRLADLAAEFHDTGDASKDFQAALADLKAQLSTGLIDPATFDAAKAELLRKAAEAGGETGKTFKDEAQRQSQGIFANFLDELAQGKLTNIVSAFGDMFRQIAAQALAARLADKLFNGVDGWLSKLGGLFGGSGAAGGIFGSIGKFFGFARGGYTGDGAQPRSLYRSVRAAFAEGGYTGGAEPLAAVARLGIAAPGYTGDGGKYEPAGFVRTQSYVLPKERVQEPGAKSFLADFNRRGMQALRDPDALHRWMQDRAPAFPRMTARLRSAAEAPGGIVHRAEHIVPPEQVRQPGALTFLREFHVRGMSAVRDVVHRLQVSRERWPSRQVAHGYAAGGLVRTAGPGLARAAAADRVSLPALFGLPAPREFAAGGLVPSYAIGGSVLNVNYGGTPIAPNAVPKAWQSKGGDTINNLTMNVQTKDGSALSKAAGMQITAAAARGIAQANARNN